MTFRELLLDLRVVVRAEREHHHARPGWLQLDCPFCGKDSDKYHLGYSLSGNYFNCWQCGPHSAIDTLMALTGKNRPECTVLASGVEHAKYIKPASERSVLITPSGLGALGGAHRRYLQGRGFDVATLEQLWRVQGIGIAPRLQWRIFIPFFQRGRMVSWTTRSINDHGLRYCSASPAEEAVNHKTLLYGEDYVRDTALVVEGPLDAWKLGPGTVATCGTGFTRSHVLRLSRYPKRVVIFDAEGPAQQRARELCDLLAPFPGETLRVTLDSKDPGSASPKEIKQIRRLFLGVR
jgi:hypothetical protein